MPKIDILIIGCMVMGTLSGIAGMSTILYIISGGQFLLLFITIMTVLLALFIGTKMDKLKKEIKNGDL